MRTLRKTLKYGIGSLLMAVAVWFILALPGFLSSANSIVEDALAAVLPEEAEIDLDLSGSSWNVLFQDIVGRSATLNHIAMISSFICSKMRPDGFGGMVTLIAEDRIVSKSTEDFLEDLLKESRGPERG